MAFVPGREALSEPGPLTVVAPGPPGPSLEAEWGARGIPLLGVGRSWLWGLGPLVPHGAQAFVGHPKGPGSYLAQPFSSLSLYSAPTPIKPSAGTPSRSSDVSSKPWATGSRVTWSKATCVSLSLSSPFSGLAFASYCF